MWLRHEHGQCEFAGAVSDRCFSPGFVGKPQALVQSEVPWSASEQFVTTVSASGILPTVHSAYPGDEADALVLSSNGHSLRVQNTTSHQSLKVRVLTPSAETRCQKGLDLLWYGDELAPEEQLDIHLHVASPSDDLVIEGPRVTGGLRCGAAGDQCTAGRFDVRGCHLDWSSQGIIIACEDRRFLVKTHPSGNLSIARLYTGQCRLRSDPVPFPARTEMGADYAEKGFRLL